MRFPPGRDYTYPRQYFEDTGIWEPRTTDYIKSHLKKGQYFLDIGAHVGCLSALAHGLGAKVIAFEPSSENRAYFEKNCPDIQVIGKALSNTNGMVKLYTGKTSGENSLLENYHNGDGIEVVESVRYDDLNLGVPDMVKLDVEGSEQIVLEGAQSILNTDKPITLIIEDWQNRLTDWLIDNYGWSLVTTDRGSGNRILVKNQACVYVEEPIRCHLLGTFNAPNTLKDEGIGNAFGTKVINMAKILKKLGHYVIFYGVEGSEVECDEFVQVSTLELLRKTYGEWDNTKIYPEKYGDLAHTTFNDNCVREINQRKREGDFLLVCHGTFHQPIANGVQIANTIEIGIGHRSSFAPFRIFESQFQMNWTYGYEDSHLNTTTNPGNRPKGDGRFYDCVIPGFFDPSDFDYSENKDDYFLYLGRIISRKGIFVAQRVCQELGKTLLVAGFGYSKDANEVDAKAFDDLLKLPNVEYVGFAG